MDRAGKTLSLLHFRHPTDLKGIAAPIPDSGGPFVNLLEQH